MRSHHDGPSGLGRLGDLGGPGPLHDPRPKAPRPLRTIVIAVAVLALVVAWMRYEPLEDAGASFACPAESQEIRASRFSDADAEQFPNRTAVCVVRNVDTTRATFVAAVRNDGWMAARLTGLRLSGVPDIFDVEGVGLAPSEAPLDPEEAEPLEGSARLPGDSTRVVTVTVTLPACGQVERARVVTLSELPLRARVLGLPRDVDVRLDPVLRLQAELCPP